MADNDRQPTGKFWGVVGGVSGAAMGFIVANVPGALAGAVAGNRLGAIRDAKGKSVYAVFQVRLKWMLHYGLVENCISTDANCRNFPKPIKRDYSVRWPPRC